MKRIAKTILYLYQWFLSPLFGGQCRFYPSCSHYALGVVEKYSLWVAVRKTLGRVVRCHPGNAGGVHLP